VVKKKTRGLTLHSGGNKRGKKGRRRECADTTRKTKKIQGVRKRNPKKKKEKTLMTESLRHKKHLENTIGRQKVEQAGCWGGGGMDGASKIAQKNKDEKRVAKVKKGLRITEKKIRKRKARSALGPTREGSAYLRGMGRGGIKEGLIVEGEIEKRRF